MARRQFGSLSFLASGLFLAASSAVPAAALEELKHEKKNISRCERQLCTMLVHKEAKGPDLKCDLTKTWARTTIKSADSSTLSWGFGDARCSVKVDVRRAEVLHAITAKKGKFHMGEQEIHCLVEEDGKPQRVTVRASPKIEFRDGKAYKVWINLKEADGPTAVTGLIRFAVSLSDGVGIFHPALVKSVNGFIAKSCPKVLATAEENSPARAAPTKVAKGRSEAPAAAAKPAEPAPVSKP